METAREIAQKCRCFGDGVGSRFGLSRRKSQHSWKKGGIEEHISYISTMPVRTPKATVRLPSARLVVTATSVSSVCSDGRKKVTWRDWDMGRNGRHVVVCGLGTGRGAVVSFVRLALARAWSVCFGSFFCRWSFFRTCQPKLKGSRRSTVGRTPSRRPERSAAA
jgi:hypothetical protein